MKNAGLVRCASSLAAIDEFLSKHLDAVAGVKNPLVAAAAKNASLRVIEGNFMVIGQACGVPRGREAAARYLSAFIEEAKASGFVADALRASGVTDATVAK
jgi:polar amino acid transport system substrate-binding protein